MLFLSLYQKIMRHSEKSLKKLLEKRLKQGKEDQGRYKEKQGIASQERPEGKLLWLHAASVGEAQSSLILIRHFHEHYPDLSILITTGTRTSAEFLHSKLPDRAVHQYYPLDYPKWCERFLDHWKPDMALWIESELWPNMLLSISGRNIPCALVNARLSKKSGFLWSLARDSARRILSCFDHIYCQSSRDLSAYKKLDTAHCSLMDNLKYSATPLPYEAPELKILQAVTSGRPLWLYASTHAGEEEMACRIHALLAPAFPDLLTIVVPRHPERREAILEACNQYGLQMKLRGDDKVRPEPEDQVYIVDTLGELGLFYRLSPLALIGRSFSRDGGGGHNPIEAAQLNCAILYGPNVQNFDAIYDEMNQKMAATPVANEQLLGEMLRDLLGDEKRCRELQQVAKDFAQSKAKGLDDLLQGLAPLIDRAGF